MPRPNGARTSAEMAPDTAPTERAELRPKRRPQRHPDGARISAQMASESALGQCSEQPSIHHQEINGVMDDHSKCPNRDPLEFWILTQSSSITRTPLFISEPSLTAAPKTAPGAETESTPKTASETALEIVLEARPREHTIQRAKQHSN